MSKAQMNVINGDMLADTSTAVMADKVMIDGKDVPTSAISDLLWRQDELKRTAIFCISHQNRADVVKVEKESVANHLFTACKGIYLEKKHRLEQLASDLQEKGERLDMGHLAQFGKSISVLFLAEVAEAEKAILAEMDNRDEQESFCKRGSTWKTTVSRVVSTAEYGIIFSDIDPNGNWKYATLSDAIKEKQRIEKALESLSADELKLELARRNAATPEGRLINAKAAIMDDMAAMVNLCTTIDQVVHVTLTSNMFKKMQANLITIDSGNESACKAILGDLKSRLTLISQGESQDVVEQQEKLEDEKEAIISDSLSSFLAND